MRIRVWNAYASNNSGSYTIVGSLPSAEVAREVADELGVMIEAHTAWRDTWDGKSDIADSPLAAFCRTHGLSWSTRSGAWDDWPEHSDDNRPRVAAIGHQVIVHHQYTISLPTAFGELFYKRGGRVDNEENHAHHPLIVIATFWWGWSRNDRAKMEIERPKLVTALTAADSVLAQVQPTDWPAAWRVARERFDDPPLTVGVIFPELIDGVSRLRAAAEQHGAQLQIRVHELPAVEHDPFAYLRPSSPAPVVPRFDVVVTACEDSLQVAAAIVEAFGLYQHDARQRLVDLPCMLARSIPQPRAEAAAARLRTAGATIDLVRNDG
jgi:hypothetical protein